MNEEIIVPGLIRRIVDKLGSNRLSVGNIEVQYNQEMVETVFNTLLSVMEDEIENGNGIRVNGYFSIKPTYKNARPVRNVHDNTEMIMPAQYRLKVKSGQKLNNACKRFNDNKEAVSV